jgi:hypothetical protein
MFKRKQKNGLGIGLADHGRKSPKTAAEQDAPEPERPVSGDRGRESMEMKERRPSQAEGERS